MIVQCPLCNADHAVSNNFKGGRVECPACRKSYPLESEKTEANGAASISPEISVEDVTKQVASVMAGPNPSRINVQKFVSFFSDLIKHLEEGLSGDSDSVGVEANQEVLEVDQDYQLLSHYGEDFFGKIQFVKKVATKQTCLIRRLSKRFDDCAEGSFAFLSNLYDSNRFHHPNILQLKSIRRRRGSWELEYEPIIGKTLYQLLAKVKRIESRNAGYLIMRVAQALRHAEAQNQGHYSLSVHRVLIDKNGATKVMDFGLNSIVSNYWEDWFPGNMEKGLSPWAYINSTSSLSPEQCLGKKRPGSVSDIYSLGCILYYLMTGQHLFSGKNKREVVEKHLAEPFCLDDSVAKYIPEGMESILRRMITVDSADRFSSWDELILELENYLEPEKESVDNEVIEYFQAKSSQMLTDCPTITIRRFLWSSMIVLGILASIGTYFLNNDVFLICNLSLFFTVAYGLFFKSLSGEKDDLGSGIIKTFFSQNSGRKVAGFLGVALLLIVPFMMISPLNSLFVHGISVSFGFLLGYFLEKQFWKEVHPFVEECRKKLGEIRSQNADFRVASAVWEGLRGKSFFLYSRILGTPNLEAKLRERKKKWFQLGRHFQDLWFKANRYFEAVNDFRIENERRRSLTDKELQKGKAEDEPRIETRARIKKMLKPGTTEFIQKFKANFVFSKIKLNKIRTWEDIGNLLFGRKFRLVFCLFFLISYLSATWLTNVSFDLDFSRPLQVTFWELTEYQPQGVDGDYRSRARFFGGPGFAFAGLLLLISLIFRGHRINEFVFPAIFAAVFLGPLFELIREKMDLLTLNGLPVFGQEIGIGLATIIFAIGLVTELVAYLRRRRKHQTIA